MFWNSLDWLFLPHLNVFWTFGVLLIVLFPISLLMVEYIICRRMAEQKNN
jgi:hypothetical protein